MLYFLYFASSGLVGKFLSIIFIIKPFQMLKQSLSNNGNLILGVNTELLDTLLCPEEEVLSSTNGCGSSTPVSGPSTTNVETEASSGDSKPAVSSPPARRPLQSFNALLISKLMAIANLSCKTGKFYFTNK